MDPNSAIPTLSVPGAQELLGDFAPKLIELAQQVIYGDMWERPELSKRERSLITIAALVAMGRAQQMPYHLELGRANGLSESEIVEVITHLAFYTGWPAAVSAAAVAKEVFGK